MGTWENVPGRISKAHVDLVALLPWTCGILPCFASPGPARARPLQSRTVLPFLGQGLPCSAPPCVRYAGVFASIHA